MNNHLGGNAKEGLKSFIERIEAREEEKREAAEDVRVIYLEAKEAGLSVKALKEFIKRRRRTDDQRLVAQLIEETVDQYVAALGEFGETPLGVAAIARRRADA